MLSPSQRQGSGCRLGMQPVNWFLVMYGMTCSCDPTLLLSNVVRKHNCIRRVLDFFFPWNSQNQVAV